MMRYLGRDEENCLNFRFFNDGSSHWNLDGLKRVLLKFEMVAHTVDGRHPTPVDMVKIPYFYRVLYIPCGFLAGFLNHQQ